MRSNPSEELIPNSCRIALQPAFWFQFGIVFLLLARVAAGQDLEPIDEVDAAPESTRTALTQFTTAIENREPIDQITFVENSLRKIFFYSDIRGLTGTQVVHRWSFDGSVRSEVTFQIMGPRWRVWSSKELDPQALGDWTVEIVTAEGETLASETFTYTAASD